MASTNRRVRTFALRTRRANYRERCSQRLLISSVTCIFGKRSALWDPLYAPGLEELGAEGPNIGLINFDGFFECRQK